MKKNFNKEIVLYIIIGIITTLINVGLFSLLCLYFEYKVSNIMTLIVVKITAYVLNKIFVFKSKCNNAFDLIYEFIKFIFFRLITLLIDYFGLILLIEYASINKIISKIIVILIVIILNYIFSKKYVFKEK